MRKQKQEFLKAVWDLINKTKSEPMDAVLHTAIKFNIEVEAAAKIIKGDPTLQEMIAREAISSNQIKRSSVAA